jgi:hypothetical protein
MFTAGSKVEEKPIVDFYIIGPSKKIVFNARKRFETMFNIEVSEPGQYSLVFSNLRVTTCQSFALVTLRQEDHLRLRDGTSI